MKCVHCWWAALVTAFGGAAFGAAAWAGQATLQNGTGTFSQTIFGLYPVSEAIDGVFSGPENGWAVLLEPPATGPTSPQTAVWETASDFTSAMIEVRMHHNHGSNHLIGRFRISVTTDARDTFADGLPTGGDVTASWTLAQPLSVAAPPGMSATILGDGSVLMGGAVPDSGMYMVRLSMPLKEVTGFRLEAMEDASLPTSGPGLQPINGNFVLSEFEVFAFQSACPEDINGDGFVDFADLNLLLGNFNTSAAPGTLAGDLDGDGDVDFGDLNQLLGLFNTEC